MKGKKKNKMIIISQDKKRIINFNNITDISIEFIHGDYELRSSFVGEIGSCNIGNYETEERAKEVFLGIIELYKKDTYYKETSLGQGIYSRKEINHTLPKVYEMPEE